MNLFKWIVGPRRWQRVNVLIRTRITLSWTPWKVKQSYLKWNLILCNYIFKHCNCVTAGIRFLFAAFHTKCYGLMKWQNMIQIHGSCHSTGSNMVACGHSNVLFFCLSTWLLSVAVTLFPQRNSSQQVIKDTNSTCNLVFPTLSELSSKEPMAGRKEKFNNNMGCSQPGEHLVSICDIIVFGNMRFNLPPWPFLWLVKKGGYI